jgi:importin subunit beta-1
MRHPNPPAGLQQASLQALGYICEEMTGIEEDVLLPAEINMILTAVVAGMAHAHNDTRLAATHALCNAIEFAQHNFDNEAERNMIMQMVCQGTTTPDVKIRLASFECLHEIAARYYDRLPQYMTDVYTITVKAIKEDDESVGLQAIEFWSTICDIEIERIESHEECHLFIQSASQHVVPILLEQLIKQEEGLEADETAWNMAMGSGTCLGLIARAIGDKVLPLVMPYVHANITKAASQEDWRYREAATFALGSVLEGPPARAVWDLVLSGLAFLVQALKDPHPYVRDTTAWTLGRIFEFVRDESTDATVVGADLLPPVMTALVEALQKDEAHIVYRVCGAIGPLATSFKGAAGGTSPMSPYFKTTIVALLEAAMRFPSFEHAKVQISAYEAINEMVRSASRDTMDVVGQLVGVVLTELHKTFDMPAVSGEAKEKQAEVQGQLCGVLQVIIQKLSENDDTKPAILPVADQVMETLLRIFSLNSSAVHEEAMLAVGAFTYATGRHFTTYLPRFVPYLLTGIANYQEWQVCLSTVGVLGDVCRNVEEAILPFCDQLMTVLMTNLSRPDVNRLIKPSILSTCGDIALVVGFKFEPYAKATTTVLRQAMYMSIQQTNTQDDELLDYNNTLRHGIFDAFSGLIQGLGPGLCDTVLREEVPAILDLLCSIGSESPDDWDLDVLKAAINLLGDLCSMLTGVSAVLRSHPNTQWNTLVTYCSEQSSMNSDTEWAVNLIRHTLST